MTRNHWLTVRLSETESRKLKKNAATAMMSPSRYVRYVCVGREDMKLEPPDPTQLAQLLLLLKRTGNNLNQLTRYAHAGMLDERTTAALEEAIAETARAAGKATELVDSCERAVS